MVNGFNDIRRILLSADLTDSSSAEIDNGGVRELKLVVKNSENIEEIEKICDWLFDAIECFGTDNIGFERAISKVDCSNIFDVMDAWDEMYGKNYGKSFIQAFLDGATPTQRYDHCMRFIECMEKRAQSLGVDLLSNAEDAKIELATFGNSMNINNSIQRIRLLLKSIEDT